MITSLVLHWINNHFYIAFFKTLNDTEFTPIQLRFEHLSYYIAIKPPKPKKSKDKSIPATTSTTDSKEYNNSVAQNYTEEVSAVNSNRDDILTNRHDTPSRNNNSHSEPDENIYSNSAANREQQEQQIYNKDMGDQRPSKQKGKHSSERPKDSKARIWKPILEGVTGTVLECG